MTTLAICLIVVGALVVVYGVSRLMASRRVLAPGEVGVTPRSALMTMVAGDLLLAIGIILVFI